MRCAPYNTASCSAGSPCQLQPSSRTFIRQTVHCYSLLQRQGFSLMPHKQSGVVSLLSS